MNGPPKKPRIREDGLDMKHVDMRKLAPAAQQERRRQVIGLRESGASYAAIAAQVGLSQTGVFDICKRFDIKGNTNPRKESPIQTAKM